MTGLPVTKCGSEWSDYLDAVAFGLSALGWRTRSGDELESAAVHVLLTGTRKVLLNLGALTDRDRQETNTVTQQERAFARAALRS